MKTLQTQFNLIKEGKGHKDVFLKEAKRLFPDVIRSAASFEEASAALKGRGVISENVVGIQAVGNYTRQETSWESAFKNFIAEEAKATEKKVSKEVEEAADKAYDTKDTKNENNMIYDQYQNGMYFEHKQNPDKSLEELKKIVEKNLAKDPIYYTKNGMFGVDGVGYQEMPVSKTDQMEKVKMNEGRISLMSLLSESDSEFQRVDKGKKDKVAKNKGEEDVYGAGVKKGEEIEKKKMKKESLDSKLAEIEKQGKISTMEAQIEAVAEEIAQRNERLTKIDEDENLAELVDKMKLKAMQKEVALLEKKEEKLKKMYEKLAGKGYQKKEMVDEMDAESWDAKNGPSLDLAPDQSLDESKINLGEITGGTPSKDSSVWFTKYQKHPRTSMLKWLDLNLRTKGKTPVELESSKDALIDQWLKTYTPEVVSKEWFKKVLDDKDMRHGFWRSVIYQHQGRLKEMDAQSWDEKNGPALDLAPDQSLDN